MSEVSAFAMAARLFERVYSAHDGPEPEAFSEALRAVEPLIPAVREQLGPLYIFGKPSKQSWNWPP